MTTKVIYRRGETESTKTIQGTPEKPEATVLYDGEGLKGYAIDMGIKSLILTSGSRRGVANVSILNDEKPEWKPGDENLFIAGLKEVQFTVCGDKEQK